MSTGIHILMISGAFMPETFGGSEHQCLRLSKELVSHGYDVTILTARKKAKTPYTNTIEGIPVERLLTYGPPHFLSLRYFIPSIIWAVKMWFWMRQNHHRYQIIHAHQGKFQSVLAVFFAKIFHKKSIIKSANSGVGFDLFFIRKRALIGKPLYKYTIRNLHCAIAISTETKHQYQEIGIPNEKIAHIPNGIIAYSGNPVNYFDDNRKGEHKTKTVFAFTGRLEEQKNLFHLIDAFSSVIKEKPDCILILIGDGSQAEELKEQVSTLNLDKRVIFTGYVNHVTELLLKCDFFILPSLLEGMSNSLLEAMNIGLIPLCTKVSGAQDLIVDENNGFLISNQDAESISTSMLKACKLSTQEKTDMGHKAYDKIHNDHDIKTVCKQYIGLYHTLLKSE